MERYTTSDGEVVESLLARSEGRPHIATQVGGQPSSHGASELCGALAGRLERVQACEVEAPCPVINAVRGWVA